MKKQRKGFELVATNVTHPAPHLHGLVGTLYRHCGSGVYALLAGACWYSIPQDHAWEIDKAQILLELRAAAPHPPTS